MTQRLLVILFSVALVSCSAQPDQVSVTINSPTGEIRDARHGKELWFGMGAMNGKNGYGANGAVLVHYLEDSTSIVGLQLNILAAQKGSFYEGWLLGGANGPLSLGKLINPFNDARHELRYEGGIDIREFSQLIVTKETISGDKTPGIVVAEGTFKEVQR